MQSSGLVTVFAQAPHPALRPYVRRLMVVGFPSAHADSHLPDTGLVAAFPFRGECLFDDGRVAPRAGLTGLHDRLRQHAHSAGNTVVLAAFTPQGAAAFIRHPLDELANTTIALSEVIGSSALFARLDDQLSSAPNDACRLQLVSDLLLARLSLASPDPLVAAALDWIEHAPPSARIAQLVRHIGLSQSALERRFRRVVGTSPRRFASLVRLQRVEHLRRSGASLTMIAHATGYFDQSHFIHDFKRVTGLAPEAYFTRAAGG